MNIIPNNYSTLVFDCDGVVLDSNSVKSQAFYNAALSYGKEFADELVAHHINNGGVSRYEKFKYFLESIIPRGRGGESYDELLQKYALEVRSGLLKCNVADGLADFKEMSNNSRWLIVSGGDQQELREIFTQRSLIDCFDGGIFGSPDNKDDILSRELVNGNITKPALFLGDSQYDHQAAVRAGLDFVFISQWTEFKQWREYCLNNDITAIKSMASFI